MIYPKANKQGHPHAGAWALWAILSIVGGFSAVEAQEADLVFGGEPAMEIGRFGAARVLESVGPLLLDTREFYQPTSVRRTTGPVLPLQLRNRWIVVQDSAFGLVFTDPSGVKPDVESYDADIYVRALQDILAVEVRSLVFNVWGELSGYLATTVLMEGRAGESWDLHPRWQADAAPTYEHRTSIMWVHRVMFEDESVLEAALDPIAAAWSHVTGSTFDGLPEESLLRAIGP